MLGWMWLLIAGCGQIEVPPATHAWPLTPRAVESSGLVRSPSHPGIFWTHNDSGADPELLAISGTGSLLGVVRVQGAEAVDWEDLAVDGAGNLWIADTGNNKNTRRDLTLYRVPEPDPTSAQVSVDRVVRFSFPEQTAFPMKGRKNFDVESLFFAGGTGWILTKHRSDQQTVLYRFPALEGEVRLERVSSFELGGDPDLFGGQATAADVSADGRVLAVLAYHAVFLFERPRVGNDWLSRPMGRINLQQGATGQCEGLAWDGWSLVFTNEDGVFYRIDDPFHLADDMFPPAAQ